MYKVKVGVSNRHVHLTKEVYETLFGNMPLEIVKPLNQIGEFASNSFVTIINGEHRIEHVRVVGPLREYNQVEISATDARRLKANPPVRKSGDVQGSSSVLLEGPNGKVALQEGLILAKRHIHMNPEEAESYGVQDNEEVTLYVKNKERSGTMNVFVKVSENGFYEVHLDTDEASAFLLQNDDEVEWEK